MKDLRYIHVENNTEIPEHKKELVDVFRKMGNNFNDKFKILRTNKKEYDKFKKNKWTIFKDNFLILVDYQCHICENRIDIHHDIDHFRPKKHYWWLAFDYKNYMIYCKLCNITYKKNIFPLFVDNQIDYEIKNRITFEKRTELDDEKPLTFNPNYNNPVEIFDVEFIAKTDIRVGVVKIKPKKDLNLDSYMYAKAKTTINIFNLNNENTELKNTQKDVRKIIMESNFKNLKNLAKLKKKFIKKPNKQNKIFYENELKKLNLETTKNGLQLLIEKGNFEIPTFL